MGYIFVVQQCLTLDVIEEQRSADNNNPRQRVSYSYYTGFRDLGLERTLPSSACQAVLGGCHGYLSKSAHGRF